MKISILKRRTLGEKIFDTVNVIIMLIICFITLYPIWYVLVNSFNDGMDAMRGGIYWWPRKFSLDSYKAVFSSPGILKALGITVAKAVIGTFLHVFLQLWLPMHCQRRSY
ncbi:hypothetical protein [Caloramator sp. Dgby_cultured_2]|uniref:hypothetical protein n=1 Tax=Caloramator sp. Dgby_cultured_2 TaxID=3029174 RepID=UPI00237DEDEA|nr:hypothetical protein [Caloramator sp. Dgby_cultured_2]WDU82915.1 hypothetical protein PWK10_15980 [Caloramator sp. Dgby_cultured_2]